MEVAMDVEDLEPGQQAPDDRDRIVVCRLPSGKFRFDGVAWGGTVQTHFADHRELDTSDEAREAGIEWAQGRQVAALLVEYQNA